jgi:hypothetical protein
MNEESLKILKMIEDRKITADDGRKLLEAMDDMAERSQPQKSSAPQSGGKILRVVIDTHGDVEENARVRVNIPLDVAKKLAGFTALIPKEAKREMIEQGIDLDAINLEELIGMFQDGLIDENLVDIETGNTGKGASVKVYVD